MVSIDGSGGDGGVDAMLRTADGRTVFEMKSYSRLTSKRRPKVASSLATAVKTVPEMDEWVLVLPCLLNRTEQSWFETELQRVAPDVTLSWRGVDWLDLQAANNLAFARYVQGSDNQLLAAASEFQLEQAVLANGIPDVFERTRRLRERVDALSMHWTTDWAVQGSMMTSTIRPKHPDAAKVDPIRLSPRFSFNPENAEALKMQAKLERTMDFGGSVELDDRYFKGFEVTASDEARLLLGNLHEPGTVKIRQEPEVFDVPIRASVRLDGPRGRVSLDVWFRERTSGLRGVDLHGSDSANAVSVDLQVPFPGKVRREGSSSFNLTFANPWSFAPVDLVPVLALHAAMQAGGRVTIKVPRFVEATTTIPPSCGDLDYSVMLRIATVVVKFEEHLGLSLRMPDGASLRDVQVAEAALAALEGEQADSGFESLTAHVQPGQVEEFIGQLPSDPFAVHTAHSEYNLILGDLEIPYGPIALWMPEVELANRAALLKRPDDTSPTATFRKRNQPIYIRSREDTLRFLDGDPDAKPENYSD